MMGKVVFILACIIACLCMFFTFTNSNNDEYEEDVKAKISSEYKENLKTGAEAREELSSYEKIYIECIFIVKEESMTNPVAKKIGEKLKYNGPEISTLDVENEYKDKLMDCYTSLMLGMKSYQSGDLDECMDYIDLSENMYEEYKNLYE